jgi:multidrug efflux pump subunit AcrA (membrane-fusion protein)
VQWVPQKWVLENMTRSLAPAADQEGAAGTDPTVFVRDGDDGLSLTARLVQLGTREGGFVQVVAGVRPGESIATGATHVLRSELMRGDIGSEGRPMRSWPLGRRSGCFAAEPYPAPRPSQV